MAATTRRKNKDAEKTFFLYVFFYHLYSSILKFFTDD